MAKYDVFISYSRLDTKIADRICEAFDAAGITYFIDRQTRPGMEFPIVLANAIQNSRIFLFLASRNAYESKFTNSEITYAFNKKSKGEIIPYIIDGSTLPEHLQFVFSSINWTYRRYNNDAPLINDLKKILPSSTHEPTPEPEPVISYGHNNSFLPDIGYLLTTILLTGVCTAFCYCIFSLFVRNSDDSDPIRLWSYHEPDYLFTVIFISIISLILSIFLYLLRNKISRYLAQHTKTASPPLWGKVIGWIFIILIGLLAALMGIGFFIVGILESSKDPLQGAWISILALTGLCLVSYVIKYIYDYISQ